VKNGKLPEYSIEAFFFDFLWGWWALSGHGFTSC
jgi:hypothetical protein